MGLSKPLLAAAAALIAAAPLAASPGKVATSALSRPVDLGSGFAAAEAGEDRFEVNLSGRHFSSRDAIEGELLLRTARLALAHGARWFELLPVPAEHDDQHPARAAPAYGAAYALWQPHWSYFRPVDGWQPWRPEWGSGFWTDSVDPADIDGWQVQAMIRLGRGPRPADDLAFDAEATARDLEAFAAR